ncbi:hypothetical protein, partial [Stenotrophomonas maltophilia]|uniref:hypothetical protein n=1 Tax=Stenotrophomonas maltophilia TaxID=40324 RepID=UPI0013DB7F69
IVEARDHFGAPQPGGQQYLPMKTMELPRTIKHYDRIIATKNNAITPIFGNIATKTLQIDQRLTESAIVISVNDGNVTR